jgi:hypothetical protein
MSIVIPTTLGSESATRILEANYLAFVAFARIGTFGLSSKLAHALVQHDKYVKHSYSIQIYNGVTNALSFFVCAHARRHVLTRLMNYFIHREDRRALNAVRNATWKHDLNKVSTNHSHPLAQLTRLQGIDTIMAIAQAACLLPYSRSTSTREVNRGAIGERAYYTIADLQQEPRQDDRPSGTIDMYVDVDFHLSDDELFREYGSKCLYTVMPKTVAGRGKDSYWYIGPDGNYTEHVCGGATYRHPVWDFGTDMVTYKRWFSFDTYHVHVVPGPANRAIVALVPAFRCRLPPRLLAFFGFEFPQLKRIGVTSNDTIVQLRSVDPTSLDVMVSTRLHTADAAEVTVKQSTWDAILYHLHVTQTPGVGGIACVAENCGERLTDGQKYILAQAARAPAEINDPVNFTRGPIIDPGTSFASLAAPPLITPASAATAHPDNAAAAVKERVTDVKNTVKVPDEYAEYAREFNSMMYPATIGKLTQLTRDQAIDRLANTPAKMRKYVANELRLEPEQLDAVMAFLKKEVTENALKKRKPSRLIFPVEVETLILVAQYTFPLKDWHKDQAIKRINGDACVKTPYIVGLTPEDTAKAVTNFVRSVDGDTCDTDFTSMDGTHGRFNVAQYGHHVRSAYDKKHHATINAVLSRNTERIIKLPVFVELRKRQKFPSCSMNLSGKSDTTDCNCWSGAFAQYAAARKAGLSPEAAFASIGTIFGDDGLTDAKFDLKTVASDLGMIIKVSAPTSKGKPVVMLSRVYVNPLHTLSSICEPVRAISRIPVVVNKDVATGLANKVEGYLVTDGHTPVVGEYCRALKRIYGLKTSLQKATADERHKLEACSPYPYDPSDRDLCVQVVTDRIRVANTNWSGMTDTECLITALNAAKCKQDLTSCRIMEAAALDPSLIVVGDAVKRE